MDITTSKKKNFSEHNGILPIRKKFICVFCYNLDRARRYHVKLMSERGGQVQQVLDDHIQMERKNRKWKQPLELWIWLNSKWLVYTRLCHFDAGVDKHSKYCENQLNVLKNNAIYCLLLSRKNNFVATFTVQSFLWF